MARREPVPPNELAICKRLRSFRLSTKIPRAAFAIAVGISSDRLSEHENGRVPVRFAVFKAIHREFYVNPRWLVEGAKPMAFDHALNLAHTETRCDDRDLLSQCYRKALNDEATRHQFDRFFAMFGPNGMASRVEEYVTSVEASESYDLVAAKDVQKMIILLDAFLKKLRSHHAGKAKNLSGASAPPGAP